MVVPHISLFFPSSVLGEVFLYLSAEIGPFIGNNKNKIIELCRLKLMASSHLSLKKRALR